MTADLPATFLKAPHKRGCGGGLTRRRETVNIDRTGRIGNGGWVAHDYCCNHAFLGCKGRVLITERAVRLMAVAAEARPTGDS